MHNLSPEEQRWLIRIILKGTYQRIPQPFHWDSLMIPVAVVTDLKAGVREKTVLSAFHPQAIELFNVSSDLKRVCWTLADRHSRLDEKASGGHARCEHDLLTDILFLQCVSGSPSYHLTTIPSSTVQKTRIHRPQYCCENDVQQAVPD